MDEAKAFMTVEVENLQKNNYMDPMQEAKGFEMVKKRGDSESKIGKGIGKTQQYVSARLGLLRLEPEIQALITSQLVTAEHGYELSKIEDAKKRTTLAELSRRDREDYIILSELREMAKLTIEELSKDSRVDAVLLRDPAEQMLRIEARVAALEKIQLERNEVNKELARQMAEHVKSCALQIDEKLGSRLSFLVASGVWKRDHCSSYKGDTCELWCWDQKIVDWEMKQDDGKWKLRVFSHPEYCAPCHIYKKKASQPTS